jgi:ketosteroid isomerase-like protein
MRTLQELVRAGLPSASSRQIDSPPVDEVEQFRATMLVRQAEAEEAFVANADAGPRMELWSRRDPVTLFGAIGMSESGWDKLAEIFPWVAARFSNVSDFRFEVEVVEVSGDMAYMLGFERFNGSIQGRPFEPVTVRVTHIYRRENGIGRSSIAAETTRALTYAWVDGSARVTGLMTERGRCDRLWTR